MKRLVFLSLIVLVIGSASVFAQRGGGGGGNRGGGMGGGGNGPGARPAAEAGQNRGGGSQRDDRNVSGERRGGGENGERQQAPRIGRELRGLDLSDEQREQIRAIQRTGRENGTDPQTVREQIRGVLTAEQAEKLEKRKEKNRPKPQGGQNQNPTGSNP